MYLSLQSCAKFDITWYFYRISIIIKMVKLNISGEQKTLNKNVSLRRSFSSEDAIMNPNQSKPKCYFCEELCLWFLKTFCLLCSDLQFLQKYCSQSKQDSVPEPPIYVSHGFKLLLAFKLWRLFIYQWLDIHVLRKPPEDMTKVARREKKKRKIKNNMEKHHRKWNKGKRIHLRHNRKKSQQQRRVEETCLCLMCHEA